MPIQSRVVKKNYTNKSKTMKKVHQRKSPQGDGEWAPSEGAYSENSIMVFTMLEMDVDGPYRSGSKGLQFFRKKTRSRMVLREVFEQRRSLVFRQH